MLSNSLGTQLRCLIAKLDGDVQTIYDEAGEPFRPRFYPIVQHLLEGPATTTRLARSIGVSQPAVTQTIAEMSKLGLVRTERGVDGRERTTTLTQRGAEMAERLKLVWGAISEAARGLDCELPQPLSKILSLSLEALDRDPFMDRIRRNVSND